MQITEDDVLDGQAAYATFKAAAGNSWAPYATAAVEEQNTQALAVWIRDNLPGGLLAAREFGSWQIALRTCLKTGALVKDPSWISFNDRMKLFNDFYNSLSVQQTRLLGEDYTPDSLNDEQERWLAIIGGVAGYKQFQNTENEIEERKKQTEKKTQQQLQREAFEKDRRR